MGIWNWTLLDGDPRTLEGRVVGFNYAGGWLGDGDWNLTVKPDNPNDPLLTNRLGNSDNGFTNHDGLIECEIEPSVDSAGDSDDDSPEMHKYFDRLMGKHVRVHGPWVSDCSHRWNGDDCYEECCDEGKTEIHPIFSIETELSESGSSPKEVDLLVFSDASPTIKPHHAGQNITAHFKLEFPPNPSHEILYVPQFNISEEKADMAESRDYQLIPAEGASGPRLEVRVKSGKPDEGKGFYHARVELKWELPGPIVKGVN